MMVSKGNYPKMTIIHMCEVVYARNHSNSQVSQDGTIQHVGFDHFFTGYEASPLADYLDIDPAIQCSELENHHVNIC